MLKFNNKRITILSGGSAIKDIMFELLRCSKNITRVVPSTDNGASSKILRECCGILSVGDIRQSLAMSIPHTQDNKQLVKFINWRFPIKEYIFIDELGKLILNKQSVLYQLSDGLAIQKELFEYLYLFLEKVNGINLSNGSIGNFILVAAYYKHGCDWNLAIESLEELFNCQSKTLPIYLDNNYHLRANFYNGTVICGESEISRFGAKNREDIASLEVCQLKERRFVDTQPKVNPSVLKSLAESELIIFSPGSFFTSILPHILNDELPLALANNKGAKKVFLVNLIQDSETINFTVEDILLIIEEIAQVKGFKLSDFITNVIINNHYDQISFYNKSEKRYYLQRGDLERYIDEGIEVIIGNLEDPWKRGEFDAKEVATLLLTL
jgi:uncharacterized cofD-like protein